MNSALDNMQRDYVISLLEFNAELLEALELLCGDQPIDNESYTKARNLIAKVRRDVA